MGACQSGPSLERARGVLNASADVSGMASAEGNEDDDIDRLRILSERDLLVMVRSPEHLLNYPGPLAPRDPEFVDRFRQPIAPEDLCLSNSTVLLHIYDLNEDLQGANGMLTFTVEEIAMGGLFHVGVEVFGSEWSYGFIGVCCDPPRTLEAHEYRCTVVLGATQLSSRDVAGLVYELCQSWSGKDYDIISQNCCSFARQLCMSLGVGELPPWVDRFARLLDKGRKFGHAVTKYINEELGGYAEMRQLPSTLSNEEMARKSSYQQPPAPPPQAQQEWGSWLHPSAGQDSTGIASSRPSDAARQRRRSRSPTPTSPFDARGGSANQSRQGRSLSRQGRTLGHVGPDEDPSRSAPMARQRSTSRSRTAPSLNMQPQSSYSGGQPPPRDHLQVPTRSTSAAAIAGAGGREGAGPKRGNSLAEPMDAAASEERMQSLRQKVTEGQFRTRRPRGRGRRGGCVC